MDEPSSDAAQRSDEALLQAARTGDLEAWRSFCVRQMPRLAAYLGGRLRRPSVVEALVVETLVAAWRELPQRAGNDDAGVWLRRLAGARAMAWHRANPAEPTAEPFPAALRPADPELAARIADLDDAIWQLPEPERRAVELRWRGGMEIAEIAQVLHRSQDEVERILAAAVAQLEQRMEERFSTATQPDAGLPAESGAM